ncbi:Autophagy protein 5 [Exophiala xenobiotica]|uniref:Autophagy protein 5 n=1 Tax=Lithohypha guttulata TaxID=1690604 RepID=A0ABR0K4D4_9EURO|nr:Autophagy protein 5 [Lithohypha guttulata]KAK5312653.1 Autophagy protein 5 [Exophiala xenobiotica]
MPATSQSNNAEDLDAIQQHVWNARLPLEIRLSASESRVYDQSDPYVISFPRLAYLPFLLPRLLNHFAEELITDIETISPDTGFFTFDGVPLKWHLPVGLLYDIYVLSTQDVDHHDPERSTTFDRKAPPFRLEVHFSQSSTSAPHLNLLGPAPAVVHDSFINSVKEADFLRSGTAKPIMSLSAADSTLLWRSTRENDLSVFSRIHASLLPTNMPWRNIPLRLYLPSTNANRQNDAESTVTTETDTEQPKVIPTGSQPQGQIRVIQSQIPPYSSASTAPTTTQLRLPSSGQGTPQTLGTALHSLLPGLFPSRRTPILAKPLLHGAPIPMNAVLEEVASKACYADGWVNIVIAITG